MRALLAQVSPVVGAIRANLGLVLDALARGRAAHADLVVLPELVLSGYPPRDLLNYGGFVSACEAAAAEAVVATEGGGPILVFGAPTRDGEGLRNSAIVAQDGRVVAVRHKALLPNYDIFDETRYFVPETHVRPVRVGRARLGITLCEDIWNAPDLFPRHRYTQDPVADLAGCDVLVNLSASPFHAGKGMLRRALVRGKAVRARAPLLFVNQVGGNDELVFDGHSLAVDAYGGLLGEAASFAPDHVLVDTGATGAGEPRDLPFEQEVVEALTLGIRDYAARCGFRSAVLGLSGGVDSAVVCALAARALGPANVLGVAMPGPYSSPISLEDARELARHLGTGFLVLPIQGPYEALRATLAERFADRSFDVAEENLQARVRGALVMALSNKEGHLVLTTGNKSEAAVGYCTLTATWPAASRSSPTCSRPTSTAWPGGSTATRRSSPAASSSGRPRPSWPRTRRTSDRSCPTPCSTRSSASTSRTRWIRPTSWPAATTRSPCTGWCAWWRAASTSAGRPPPACGSRRTPSAPAAASRWLSSGGGRGRRIAVGPPYSLTTKRAVSGTDPRS